MLQIFYKIYIKQINLIRRAFDCIVPRDIASLKLYFRVLYNTNRGVNIFYQILLTTAKVVYLYTAKQKRHY